MLQCDQVQLHILLQSDQLIQMRHHEYIHMDFVGLIEALKKQLTVFLKLFQQQQIDVLNLF